MDQARREVVLCVFGTRPEAVKMAPVVRALERSRRLRPYVCVTAQHRELLDMMLRDFQLRPDCDLDLMRPGQSLSAVTCGVLTGLEEVIRRVDPALVLVHGDTVTALAAALAARYARVPLGHVEAGLRSHDMEQPFPEELDRVLIDRLSTLHFAPTRGNRRNLLAEGIDPEGIFVTGNTVADAMVMLEGKGKKPPVLRALPPERRLLLLTAHRRETQGEPMRRIFRAVRRCVRRHRDVSVLLPMHPNPAVRKLAEEELGGEEQFFLTGPLEAGAFHSAMRRCELILSDSGGVQEEAAVLGRHVLVLREVTERPEGLAAGYLHLAGTREDRVEALLESLLSSPPPPVSPGARLLYGDRHAAGRIVAAAEAFLTGAGR